MPLETATVHGPRPTWTALYRLFVKIERLSRGWIPVSPMQVATEYEREKSLMMLDWLVDRGTGDHGCGA